MVGMTKRKKSAMGKRKSCARQGIDSDDWYVSMLRGIERENGDREGKRSPLMVRFFGETQAPVPQKLRSAP